MEKVLIVEDRSLYELITKILMRMTPETTVTTFENGDDAIKTLARESFDFVFTGYRRPGADGLEVVRQARKHSPKAVIVFMTTSAHLEKAVRESGANHFFTKPGGIMDLLTEMGFVTKPSQTHP